MRFGKTLARSVYPPWADHYVDYAKLKRLLREDSLGRRDAKQKAQEGEAAGDGDMGDEEWTEEDEKRFCDEVFNVQLEKVACFQQDRVCDLRARIDAAMERLKLLAPVNGGEQAADGVDADAIAGPLRELEAELDAITDQVNQVKRYSGDNYTGFLKIVKKHDRKRGQRYRIRPLMQLSLAQRPFNSLQAYTPLLDRLSVMYFAIHQVLDHGAEQQQPRDPDSQREWHNGERYSAHKFWVHPENLVQVKTLILRRLPSLAYSEQASRATEGGDAPSTTSLYLDNDDFELYTGTSHGQASAVSLRLRWHGPLSDRPDILVEQRTTDGLGDREEARFTIKAKYVKPFLDGEYALEKTVQKMQRTGLGRDKIESFQATVARIQHFLRDKRLSPMVRANYVRTAFQRPGDDRVRISLDTELAFVREDALNREGPCRDPSDWHRHDIDDSNMTYPFASIDQREISRFPFAVLEVKLKEAVGAKRPSWIEGLMASHLVRPVPRFSKFTHGVACLLEDYVTSLPLWLGDLETDIRRDPQQAFEEEEQRRAQRADDAIAVGSLIRSMPSSCEPWAGSSHGGSPLAKRLAAESSARVLSSLGARTSGGVGEGAGGEEEEGESSGLGRPAEPWRGGYGTMSSVVPSFARAAASKRARLAEQRQLPEGVVEPKVWIKNAGEVKVEPKVWLANERTFLKWQHIGILQGGLAVALYVASGRDTLAEAMGIVYVVIAVCTGAWGYWMMRTRQKMIVERSGRDLDNVAGPIVISTALMLALVANFVLQYQKALTRMAGAEPTVPG